MNKKIEKKIEVREKQAKVLALKKTGATFDQIAATLGYANASGAYKAFQAALHETIRVPAEEYRDLQTERLEKIIQVLWPDVLARKDKAIHHVRGAIKDIRELHGLDLPRQVEVSTNASILGAALLTDEQLMKIARQYPEEVVYDETEFLDSPSKANRPARGKKKSDDSQ